MSAPSATSWRGPAPIGPHSSPTFRWWIVPLALLVGVVAVGIGWIVLVILGIVHPPAYGGPYPGFFWPIFPFGFFLALVVLFLVVRATGWGWGWTGRRGCYGGGVREILRERYARGEISREQLRAMLQDLDETE